MLIDPKIVVAAQAGLPARSTPLPQAEDFDRFILSLDAADPTTALQMSALLAESRAVHSSSAKLLRAYLDQGALQPLGPNGVTVLLGIVSVAYINGFGHGAEWRARKSEK